MYIGYAAQPLYGCIHGTSLLSKVSVLELHDQLITIWEKNKQKLLQIFLSQLKLFISIQLWSRVIALWVDLSGMYQSKTSIYEVHVKYSNMPYYVYGPSRCIHVVVQLGLWSPWRHVAMSRQHGTYHDVTKTFSYSLQGFEMTNLLIL